MAATLTAMAPIPMGIAVLTRRETVLRMLRGGGEFLRFSSVMPSPISLWRQNRNRKLRSEPTVTPRIAPAAA